MPDLTGTTILFGVILALACRMILKTRQPPRRLPLWGAVLIAAAGAVVAGPVLDVAGPVLGSVPVLSGITGDALFIGGWTGLLALTLFERKGQPRRVPVWAAMAVALLATVTVPPLLDAATGKYQDASLQANVNNCTSGMRGQVTPRAITNICDHPIVVGLCLSHEENPDPCRQAVRIAPGATASFDPGDERLSALPSNLNGLTVVACRPPHRPSRTLKVGARGYRGVCLPGA